jgi:uncharacterized protein (TIGR03435 family)
MKTILAAAALAATLCGQAAAPTHFDAASIRPSPPPTANGYRIRLQYSPGRIMAQNVDLKMLLESAYGLQDYQLQAPGWLGHDRFDLNAEVQQPLGRDAMAALLKPFLIRQFGLATHTVRRMVNIYAIETSAAGAKLAPARGSASRPVGIALSPSGFVVPGVGTLSDLAAAFSHVLDRPVVDDTRIQGRFRYNLHFTLTAHLNPVLERRIGEKQRMARAQGIALPPVGPAKPGAPPPPPNGRAATAAPIPPAQYPSLFTAIRKQLGLKLVPRKAPVTVLVVDHANRLPRGSE